MKTFTKHILLLALMLFGVAGAAWASRAPQKFTGDTLAPGFELTCGDGNSSIKLIGGTYKFDGNVMGQNIVYNCSAINNNLSFGPDLAINFTYNSSTNINLPWDGTRDGNAWLVTDRSATDVVSIVGIYIRDPYVPALDELTGNWNFLMPGSNKVVKAVLYDSIVVGPHVELFNAEPAFAAGDIYSRGDSTIYYYDTNNHHSFHLRADEQADGKYFGFWADLDPTDPQYTDRTNRYVSPGYLTCGQRYTAAYANNYTLTLAREGYGTLKLDGERVDTFYNITFEHDGSSGDNRSFTIPASRLPYDTTFNYDEDIYPASVNEPSGNLSIINQGDRTVTISISGAFIEHDGSYSCMFLSEDHDNWTITCEDNIVPVTPYGISKTGNGTYSVMEGLTVNVTATPDSAHYLARIDGHDTVSNYACGYSFVMPSNDKDLLATFNDKPTLTLAQTDGGTLEAIVPEGGVTAMHPTTDQISTWDGVYEYAMETDLQQFSFVAVDSAAAAAWTGVPASGQVLLVYATAGNQFKAIIFQDGQWYGTYTSNFYKGEIYSYTNSDMIYFTTGTVAPNVIASSTPNTYYIDYGTPVTVVATPDAQHYLVSFSDDAPATERNSNLAVEKTYDSVIADIPDLSANFQAKPTLTLTANDGGTLSLDGMTYDTVYNITFVHSGRAEANRSFTIPASLMSYDTTFSYDDNVGTVGVNEPSGKLSIINRGERTVTISISGECHGIYSCDYGPGIFDQWGIDCGASTVPVYPAGVVSANATLDTFVVDYGTDVTVVATPDATHYLATLGEELVNSNDSIHRTINMTAPVNLPADFRAKPTLTLDHNQGGEMEVIPEEVMVVNEFTVPSTWSGDYSFVAATDLPSDFQSVSVVEALAWQNTTGQPVILFFKASADGSSALYVRFMADGTNTGTSMTMKHNIYNDVSHGYLVRYTTVGYANNFIASTTEPNTYYIDYNTSVTVKATPSDTAYLVRFDQDAGPPPSPPPRPPSTPSPCSPSPPATPPGVR